MVNDSLWWGITTDKNQHQVRFVYTWENHSYVTSQQQLSYYWWNTSYSTSINWWNTSKHRISHPQPEFFHPVTYGVLRDFDPRPWWHFQQRPHGEAAMGQLVYNLAPSFPGSQLGEQLVAMTGLDSFRISQHVSATGVPNIGQFLLTSNSCRLEIWPTTIGLIVASLASQAVCCMIHVFTECSRAVWIKQAEL